MVGNTLLRKISADNCSPRAFKIKSLFGPGPADEAGSKLKRIRGICTQVFEVEIDTQAIAFSYAWSFREGCSFLAILVAMGRARKVACLKIYFPHSATRRLEEKSLLVTSEWSQSSMFNLVKIHCYP